jgi:predicted metal-dependent TIM-barrel fold hydrolase
MFDAHTHVDTIRCEDIEMMAISGIKRLMLCLGPNGASVHTTILDYYEQLLTTHSTKVRNQGITPFLALGVHPMSIPKDYTKALANLPTFIKRGSVVAIGEVGIHTGSDLERSVFRSQVEIAKDHGMPMIIHTPIPEKRRIVEIILEILKQVGLDPKKTIVDHSTGDVANKILDCGANVGLTLRRDMLSNEEAYEILRMNPDRVVLGSDANGLRPSDPLSVPRLAWHCRSRGLDETAMRKVLWENPNRIFDLEQTI